LPTKPPNPLFIHLRVHSSYSLCESPLAIKDMIGIATRARMPALACTDTNALFGAFEFSTAAAKAGIQPILGTVLDVELPDPVDGSRSVADTLLLLCQDERGWKNLCRIVSAAHLESGGAEPRVPRRVFDQPGITDGLLCLSGGASAAIVRKIVGSGSDAGAQWVKSHLTTLSSLFPGRLYIELQRCGEPWEAEVEQPLIDCAYDVGLPLVATNDVFCGRPDQARAHRTLLCIREGKTVFDTTAPSPTAQHWLKPAQDMAALFADLPEAIQNTVEVAKRCAFMLERRKPSLPRFPLPEGTSAEQELRSKVNAGLSRRFETTVVPRLGREEAERLRSQYWDRMEYELGVINQMDFAGYFLIVADFMGWTERQDIPVGVRGSGATSIVAWSLEITHLDPIRFGLVFERFLNPERISLPDFDIDFCQERRPEVIRYVASKYGTDNVAQIITFGKLQARAALRDVGRVVGAPYGLIDRMCGLVNPQGNLHDSLAAEPQLQALLDRDPQAKEVFDWAEEVEGAYRHASTHAAGVVIADRPLTEFTALYKDPSSDMPVTQFHYKDVEEVGLAKFDFLGLRTLTIIARCQNLIEQLGGGKVRARDAGFEHDDVFAALGQGDSLGVFQLESSGMRDLLRRLKPQRIEHLIALISLYRPGPMDSIPQYIARARGEEKVVYDHPLLADVLQETYGIITYQEDVMRIGREMAGYTMGEADSLRRAMGKKIKAEMDQHRQRFIDGAAKRDVPKSVADAVFDQCAKFAGYGFNKGHAAAYAQVSFETAYLKCKYPAAFLAACMSVDISSTDRLASYWSELREKGIKLLPPDANGSQGDFSLVTEAGKVAIRYGLGALKGVGMAAAQAIVSARAAGEFRDLEDFFSRVPATAFSRSVAEKLVDAGVFDSLERNRAKIRANLDRLLGLRSRLDDVQQGLFGGDRGFMKLTEAPPAPRAENVERAAKVFGFYLDGHPLDWLKSIGRELGLTPLSELTTASGNSGRHRYRCAVRVDAIRKRQSQTGRPYAFVTVSDAAGTADILVFSEVLTLAAPVLLVGEIVVLDVALSTEADSSRLTLVKADPIASLLSQPTTTLHITLKKEAGPKAIPELDALLPSSPSGSKAVAVIKLHQGLEVEVDLHRRVLVTPALLSSLEQAESILGVRVAA
jgi:DNA polymerase III subunit alpha